MINHQKFTWKILDGINFTMCYDQGYFHQKIAQVLEARIEGEDIGGVLMPMESNNDSGALKGRAQFWQKMFPLANIIWIDKTNVEEYKKLKEQLRSKDKWTDIDLLIVSPVWSAGIDIQNKFSLTAGNFYSARKRKLDGEELFNFLTRERHPKEIIALFDRAKENRYLGAHWDKYQKLFSTPISQYDQYCQIVNYIKAYGGGKINLNPKKQFTSDLTQRYPRPEWQYYIEGLTEVAKDNMLSKAFALQKLPEIAKGYGANVYHVHTEVDEQMYPTLLRPEIKPYDLGTMEEPDELRNLKTDINRTLGYAPRIKEDLYKFKAESQRREAPKELLKLIKEINSIMINNPQFILSNSFTLLLENQEKYRALLTDKNWIDPYSQLNAPLKLLHTLANFYGIEAKLQRGSSEPMKDLLTNARKEGAKEYNSWRRKEGAQFKEKYQELKHPYFEEGIKNITYPLYLWNGLNEGLFSFHDLGEFTKKYIQTFDHIIFEGLHT